MVATKRDWALALDTRAFSVARIFGMHPYVGICKGLTKHAVGVADVGDSSMLSQTHMGDIYSPSKAPAMAAYTG